MSFDVQNFQEDVVDASSVSPIVVDFWAPWCGPCRVLGPVLEKLDTESGDDWKLVKVNTDENPELSAQFGIRGIPAVKMFIDGSVIAEFTGVLPEHSIKQWLSENLPKGFSDGKAAIQALLESANLSGDFSSVLTALEAANGEDPANPFYAAELAKLVVWSAPIAANDLVSNVVFDGRDGVQLKESIATVEHISNVASGAAGVEAGASKVSYLEASSDVVSKDFESAISKYIDIIGRDRYYDDDGSRKACIALFTLLGPKHKVTSEYRRRFDMALY